MLCDNLGTVTLASRNGSEHPILDAIMRDIAYVCLRSNTHLWFRWLRRNNAGIVLADKLSKAADMDDWQFNPAILRRFIDYFGFPEPTIDCCASAANAQCACYISAHWDGTSVAVDLLQQQNFNWSNEVAWINPPFSRRFILRVLEMILAYGIPTMLVVPHWDKQPFMAVIRREAQSITMFGRNQSLFIPPATFKAERKRQRWDTIVATFNIDPKRETKALLWKYCYATETFVLKPD